MNKTNVFRKKLIPLYLPSHVKPELPMYEFLSVNYNIPSPTLPKSGLPPVLYMDSCHRTTSPPPTPPPNTQTKIGLLLLPIENKNRVAHLPVDEAISVNYKYNTTPPPALLNLPVDESLFVNIDQGLQHLAQVFLDFLEHNNG